MRWSQVSRRLVATAAIGAAVAGVCTWGLTADRLDAVQSRWEDLLQPGVGSSDGIVIVGIDRASLAAVESGGSAWPWPRDLHAELLSRIGEGEPAAVIYDVLFADRRPGDEVLAAEMTRTPTVLPAELTLAVGPGGPPRIVDEIGPVDPLASAAAAVGHANITNAGDTGVVRTLPLYAVDDREVAQPSVVLAAIAVADGGAVPLIERRDGVQVGQRFVPLDDAELRINWADSLGPSDVIPAIDVLSGAVDPATFRDNIVLVGVTDPALGDEHLVPVDRSGGVSGVVVLANATNTVVAAGYLTDSSPPRQIAVIALAAIVVAAAFVWLRLLLASIVAVAVITADVLFTTWRFHADGVVWNLVWPVLAVLLAAAAGTVWRYTTESRYRRRAWRLFSTYVPAEVVRQLEDPGRLATAESDLRCEVSVVFCDIRNFTTMAGSMQPARVRQLLDAYYGYVVSIVHRHRGTVMQFVGDEVFAVFGAPVASEADAAAAVRCAVALQDEVASLDDRLAVAGLPQVRFGIGVHRGSVVAAHVGTEDRRQYAVVGETVNVGDRLCDSAEPGQIVVSERAWRSATAELQRHFNPAGSITLKGVRAPMSVYRATRSTAVVLDSATPGTESNGEQGEAERLSGTGLGGAQADAAEQTSR